MNTAERIRPSNLAILKWMVAGIYALLTVIGLPSVWLLVRVAAKLGALS